MNSEESTQAEETPSVPEAPKATKKPAPKHLSKSRPVTVYLVILFLVALLLLAMSFFMQQRSHQALENLNESMSASQDLTALQMDKQRLEFELQQAKDDLTQAQEALDEAEKEAQAIEWLRQMESAARTSYSQLKAIVEQFEESGLADFLPAESVVEGKDSPADAYRAIYAMIY